MVQPSRHGLVYFGCSLNGI
ncbi:hypothetical protein HU200_042662 [Digitaria exilis]|uniref:Uncharacterized protein n=1 Tax=Digitaria exilis TaxID=1010633 RepID=A0A835B206_9POAL|nr:hypothetical protein HU200_058823 [Digitaria exilis]KAF8687732.1 hypothetical protein HU200_042662 [Digitaria exilis]